MTNYRGSAIDFVDSDRYDNKDPYKYSVFEHFLIDKEVTNLTKSDGYSSVLLGLDIMKNNMLLFDIEYLKQNHKKYLKMVSEKLPEHLRNLGKP